MTVILVSNGAKHRASKLRHFKPKKILKPWWLTWLTSQNSLALSSPASSSVVEPKTHFPKSTLSLSTDEPTLHHFWIFRSPTPPPTTPLLFPGLGLKLGFVLKRFFLEIRICSSKFGTFHKLKMETRKKMGLLTKKKKIWFEGVWVVMINDLHFFRCV